MCKISGENKPLRVKAIKPTSNETKQPKTQISKPQSAFNKMLHDELKRRGIQWNL